MTISIHEWHKRFMIQAQWTQSLRSHLYHKVDISRAKRIIEIGCGTGVLLSEMPSSPENHVFGLDIDMQMLSMVRHNLHHASIFQADAHHIPLCASSFDLSFCHFLLLWIRDPQQVVCEMMRITRPGGVVCALAEPDYGGRIDFPDELVDLGQYQIQALRTQGANPKIGRQLRRLLSKAGLIDIVAGVLGGQWVLPFEQKEWESEWVMIESDLADSPTFQASKQTKKAQDRRAWVEGERILYVPTFYAWGKVPG